MQKDETYFIARRATPYAVLRAGQVKVIFSDNLKYNS